MTSVTEQLNLQAIQNKKTALRRYFEFLISIGIRSDNPLPKITRSLKIPEGAEKEKIDKFEQALDKQNLSSDARSTHMYAVKKAAIWLDKERNVRISEAKKEDIAALYVYIAQTLSDTYVIKMKTALNKYYGFLISKEICAFEQALEEQGLGPRTRANTMNTLKQAALWLRLHNERSVRISEATQEDIDALLAHIAKTSGDGNVSRIKTALRRYYEFLISEEICAFEQALEKRKQKPSPRALANTMNAVKQAALWLRLRNERSVRISEATQEDIDALLAHIAKTSGDGNVSRIKAALRRYYEFLISIGIRPDNPLPKITRSLKIPEGTEKEKINEFEQALEKDDLRIHTRANYKNAVKKAAAWLYKERSVRISEATSKDIAALYENIKGRAKAPETKTALRRYYEFLISIGIRSDNPLPEKQIPLKIPEGAEKEKIDEFEQALDKQNLRIHTRANYKNAVIKAAEWLHNERSVLISEATQEDIDALLAHIAETSGDGNVSRIKAALRKYYEFLISKGTRPDNPLSEKQIPLKIPEGLRRKGSDLPPPLEPDIRRLSSKSLARLALTLEDKMLVLSDDQLAAVQRTRDAVKTQMHDPNTAGTFPHEGEGKIWITANPRILSWAGSIGSLFDISIQLAYCDKDQDPRIPLTKWYVAFNHAANERAVTIMADPGISKHPLTILPASTARALKLCP